MTVSDRDLRIIEECKASDEPCIVFRAQDRYAPSVLRSYLEILSPDPSITDEFRDAVLERIKEMDAWQAENNLKVHTPNLRPGEATS